MACSHFIEDIDYLIKTLNLKDLLKTITNTPLSLRSFKRDIKVRLFMNYQFLDYLVPKPRLMVLQQRLQQNNMFQLQITWIDQFNK